MEDQETAEGNWVHPATQEMQEELVEKTKQKQKQNPTTTALHIHSAESLQEGRDE